MKRDIGRKSPSFHIQPAIDAPVRGGVPSEYCHNAWCGKTRVVWLPDGEKNFKIHLLVSLEYTNVTGPHTDGQTDGQTPHHGIGKLTVWYNDIVKLNRFCKIYNEQLRRYKRSNLWPLQEKQFLSSKKTEDCGPKTKILHRKYCQKHKNVFK